MGKQQHGRSAREGRGAYSYSAKVVYIKPLRFPSSLLSSCSPVKWLVVRAVILHPSNHLHILEMATFKPISHIYMPTARLPRASVTISSVQSAASEILVCSTAVKVRTQ